MVDLALLQIPGWLGLIPPSAIVGGMEQGGMLLYIAHVLYQVSDQYVSLEWSYSPAGN